MSTSNETLQTIVDWLRNYRSQLKDSFFDDDQEGNRRKQDFSAGLVIVEIIFESAKVQKRVAEGLEGEWKKELTATVWREFFPTFLKGLPLSLHTIGLFLKRHENLSSICESLKRRAPFHARSRHDWIDKVASNIGDSLWDGALEKGVISDQLMIVWQISRCIDETGRKIPYAVEHAIGDLHSRSTALPQRPSPSVLRGVGLECPTTEQLAAFRLPPEESE